MPRSRSSGALSIWSKAVYLASLAVASTLVMAAVRVGLPWSMWPIVPILTWGLVRSNFCFAISYCGSFCKSACDQIAIGVDIQQPSPGDLIANHSNLRYFLSGQISGSDDQFRRRQQKIITLPARISLRADESMKVDHTQASSRNHGSP